MKMLNNSHILVIDNVVDNIKVALNILKEEHKELSFAMQGEKALAMIEKQPTIFDLILLDIMMPGMNGYEVCKKTLSLRTFQLFS